MATIDAAGAGLTSLVEMQDPFGLLDWVQGQLWGVDTAAKSDGDKSAQWPDPPPPAAVEKFARDMKGKDNGLKHKCSSYAVSAKK